jgi:two-component system, sensor histidine kinase LadS
LTNQEKVPTVYPLIYSLIVATLIHLGFSGQAVARELIVDQAFVEDPSGSWTLEDAKRRAVTPFAGVLTRGYGKGAIWVRLRVDANPAGATADKNQFLRIRPIFIDEIQLFDEADGFLPRPPVGDRHGFSASTEPGPFYIIELTRWDSPRELWLRIESTSTRLAYFEVLNTPALRNSNLSIQLLSIVYLTLITSFFVLGLFQWFARRDLLNWSFALYQFIALVHGTISLGYARWWASDSLSPSVFDRLFSFFIVVLTFTALLFTAALLREFSNSKQRNFLLYGLLVVLISLLSLQYVGFLSLSLIINSLATLILPVIFFAFAVVQQRNVAFRGQLLGLSKTVVITYFSLTLVFAYLGALPVLGWLTAVTLSLYWIQFYCLSSGLLMLALLQHRSHVLTREQDALIAEARRANERADYERTQRLERQQLLNMLGHELKTPIATLKMLLGDRNVPSAVAKRLSQPLSEMTEVVERTVQSAQLEEGAIELQWQIRDVVTLIQKQLSSVPGNERVVFEHDASVQNQLLVRTDPYFFGVILRNLLDNALRYSPDDSSIVIHLGVENQMAHWTLTVSNEVGRAGRPDPEKLFSKYWRSPSASYRSGSGQGLFIVSRLAGLLGGKLSLEPDIKLVVFQLLLPISNDSLGDSTI